jgi:Lon protease-like protein
VTGFRDEAVDERQAVLRALGAIPVFPLPAAVLIPGGHLPLHVFEPRYRRMIEDVLAGDRVLAVALLEPGWEADYQGRPPLHEVIGVGYVQADERLPDGRHLILVHGVTRARVVEELPEAGLPYRRVRAELLADRLPAPDAALAEASATTLRQLVVDLAAALPDGAAATLAEACMKEHDAGRLADLVGASVLVDARDRQEFLEELAVLRRLDRTSETVAQVLLEFPAGSGGYVM